MAYITPRPDKGGYLVRWREGGRGSRARSKFFRELADAEAYRAQVERETDVARLLRETPGIPGWEGEDVGPGAALEEEYAMEVYIRATVETDRALRQTSKETYLIALRTHIEGTPLGRADIRTVQPDDLQRYWDALTCGPGALRGVRQLLSKAFRRAVRHELIPSNPMERADIRAPGKRRATEVIPLTVPEIEALAAATTTEQGRLAVLVMGYGGLRAGEVGGLRVQDVDFGRCQLRLRQQVARTHSGAFISELKTAAARRTVALACSVTEELRGLQPARDGRLFYGAKGALWSHQALRKIVADAAVRARIGRPVSPHMLRHSAVSLLIDDGANPKAIQAFVGHSTITETLQTYGHLFDYGGQALADSMERRREQHRNGT
jgi:integrase